MGKYVRQRYLSFAVVGALLWTTLSIGQTRPTFSAALSGDALPATVSSAPQTCQSTAVAHVLRTVQLGNPRVLDPLAVAVDTQTGRVFVATAPYSVSVLDSQTGALLRSVGMGPNGPEPLAIAADQPTGHVFVANYGADNVSMLDSHMGNVLHIEPVPSQPVALAIDDRTHHIFVASFRSPTVSLLDTYTGAALPVSPTVSSPLLLVVDTHAGNVFVSDGSDTVYMLDATTGALGQSTFFTDYADVHEMAVDEQTGRLFATGTGDTVHVLDTHSGALLRVVKVGANPYNLAVSASTGRVFVANHNASTVSVLDATTGEVLRTVDIGATPQSLAVDGHTGRVFVSTDAGGVAILDATSGALLQSVGVGQQPQALAVDERAGRVFVLDTQRATVTTLAEAPPTPAHTPASPAQPTAGARYFARTCHSLSGPFLTFWTRYGDVDTFGYPRTEPFTENGYVVQYTDRFLLELVHGQVQTAPLGRQLTAGRTFPPVQPFTSTSNSLYFAATRHSLSGRFLAWWRGHNGAILLGRPISEVVTEGNGDGSGRRYPLQWFENGRLEYHPELAGTRYAMELGLLGVQALQQRGWLP